MAPPANAEYAHAHITGSELYWMDGSHVAFVLEAADTAPAYVVNWLRAQQLITSGGQLPESIGPPWLRASSTAAAGSRRATGAPRLLKLRGLR